MIKSKQKLSIDTIIDLPEELKQNIPKLDISITSSAENACGISEKIHDFLLSEGIDKRTSFMGALCLEELAEDFITTVN